MAKKPRKEVDERSDIERIAQASLKWLYELELLNSPTLLNHLYGNLYAFPKVDDCEIIIDRFQKKMLIWIRFTWFTRSFFKTKRRQLITEMLDQLQELLPSFEFRLTEDRALFEKALKKTKRSLFGGEDVLAKDKETKPEHGATLAPDPLECGGPAPTSDPWTPGNPADPGAEAIFPAAGPDKKEPT